ncbi:hypothetical protein U1Q18_025778 [Sarracenia purpurea var. burkii]
MNEVLLLLVALSIEELLLLVGRRRRCNTLLSRRVVEEQLVRDDQSTVFVEGMSGLVAIERAISAKDQEVIKSLSPNVAADRLFLELGKYVILSHYCWEKLRKREKENSITSGNRARDEGTGQGDEEQEVDQAPLEKRAQIVDLTLPEVIDQAAGRDVPIPGEIEHVQETIEGNP